MPNVKCCHCDYGYVVSKNIELRQINTKTMALASSRHLVERECLQCGHLEIVEAEALTAV